MTEANVVRMLFCCTKTFKAKRLRSICEFVNNMKYAVGEKIFENIITWSGSELRVHPFIAQHTLAAMRWHSKLSL
jgi:hypothetical protein